MAMGAQACGPSACNSDSSCCGSNAKPDMEYAPKPEGEAHREVEEPGPPQAVVGARPQNEEEDGFESEGEDGSGESYFTRELQELRRMSTDGLPADGPRPKFTFSTGATYLGQWKSNSRHGVGVQSWVDGAKFSGKWSDSNADGNGQFMHADGDIFVGQWKSNAAQGLGSYYHRKGQTTYRGEWVEDLQHGQGVEQWDGGSRYSGQFVWGKKQGFGVYEWPDGSVYRGEWQANSINGFGHYIGKDGREFRGMWKGAVIHGCGKYSWPDGRTFGGQYADDQKEGFGIFTWRDGRRFEGWWKGGKQDGYGIAYRKAGEVSKRGMWKKGKAPETPEMVPEIVQ